MGFSQRPQPAPEPNGPDLPYSPKPVGLGETRLPGRGVMSSGGGRTLYTPGDQFLTSWELVVCTHVSTGYGEKTLGPTGEWSNSSFRFKEYRMSLETGTGEGS